MPSRTALTAATYVAILVFGGALAALTFEGADAAEAPTPATALVRLGSTYSTTSTPDRYSSVVVGRSSALAAAALPGRSLVYHSGTQVCSTWDAGVPYSVASASGWLLRSASGVLLANKSYPNCYIADVGSAAYQAEWARRVGDYLKSVGADGVFIDDVNANASTLTSGAVFPAKYPDQASWENAMTSFIAAVGPALKARGLYVLVSAGKWIGGDARSNDGTLVADFWRRLGPYVSGFFNEYFMQSPTDRSYFRGDGTAWYDHWNGWSGLIDVAQGMGRDFVGMTYGSLSNTQAMRYVRATFLLYWNGGGGAHSYHVDGGETWSPEWTITVGAPSGTRYKVGVGWRRDYSGGTVLVNPSLSTSQTFSLGATYVTPSGSSVTSVTLSPKSGLVLRSGPTLLAAKPVNTALPAISGTAQQGLSLSSSTGTWSNSPTAYARQWQRCDSAGAACSAISGATGAGYTLASVDVGKTLRVAVTATNSAGSTTAVSAPSAVVTAAPVSKPVNTALPAISGTAQQGLSLSSSTGTWSNSPTAYARQWQRCDSAGAACSAISGATGAGYTLASVDVGKTLRVAVTATNSAGSTTAVSAPSAVVTAAPVSKPVNTALPAISGTAQQGLSLSSSTGAWSNSPTSYGYQWRRCDSGGAACADVVGATGSQFALTSSDVGKTLRVVVTAANAGGATSATSAASAVVAAAPAAVPVAKPVNSSLPVISGTAQEGNSLSASTGSWSNSPTSYAYQWRRCDSAGAGCADIGGATASQFGLTTADVGKTLRVAVTATNSGGSSTATSSASAVVAPAPVLPPAPTNTSVPNVTGPERIEKSAASSAGSWDGSPTSITYQWLRCGTEDLTSCVAIPGATESSYTFVADDRDKYVIVKVTASNAGGSRSVTSKFGRPVKG